MGQGAVFFEGVRRWIAAQRGGTRAVQTRGTPRFDPLEPRLLLNADLMNSGSLLSLPTTLGEPAIVVGLNEEDQPVQEAFAPLASFEIGPPTPPAESSGQGEKTVGPLSDADMVSQPIEADLGSVELVTATESDPVESGSEIGAAVQISGTSYPRESASPTAADPGQTGTPGSVGIQPIDIRGPPKMEVASGVTAPDTDTSWISGSGPSALMNLGDRIVPAGSESVTSPTLWGSRVFNVCVESGLLAAIQTSLNTYVADLTTEGYQVTVQEFGGDAAALRAELQNQWRVNHLEGALFVGDLPYVTLTTEDNFDSAPVDVTYLHDLYFMDLDGTYVLNSTGTDAHLNGSGDVGPEIYVSRITTSNLDITGKDEATLINQYFAKVHAYRTGALSFSSRGIVFADDDWSGWGSEQMDGLYSEVLAIHDPSATTRAGYLNALAQDYESILECTHGNGVSQGHYLKVPPGPGEFVDSSDVLQANPRPGFYNLFTCDVAVYTEPNHVIGAYVYGGSYGLNAVGSTKTGGMLHFPDYYHPQSLGDSLGQAFMEWFSLYAYPTDDQANDAAVDWFYGMTMQGDPTLKTRAQFASAVVKVSDNGVEIHNGDRYPGPTDGTNFGSVAQGGAAITRTFMVRNDGTVALTLGPVTVPTGYTLTEALSSSLAPGASDTFTVQLDTAAVGTKVGDVSFSTNDSDQNPFSFRIMGAVTGPEVTVLGNEIVVTDGETAPSTLSGTDFATVPRGGTAISHVFTVRNDGTGTLTLGAVAVPTGFTLTDGLSNSLAPGASDTFTVRLDAATAGTKSGDILFSTNDLDENPFNFRITGLVTAAAAPEVTVLGNGCLIVDGDAMPSTSDWTDFGAASRGGATVSRIFTVRNDGTAALTLATVMVPTGYTLTDGLVVSLAAGASDTFTVRLDTTTVGTKSGEISFSTNDSDENPFNFRVTGAVLPPTVRVAYVVPSNRTAQTDAVANLRYAVQVQQDWYRDQMERNGFGAKTFLFETQADGVTPLIHTIHVSETDDYLRGDIWNRVGQAAANAGVPIWTPGQVWLLVPEIHLQHSDGSIEGGVATGATWGSGIDAGVAMMPSAALVFMNAQDMVDDRPYNGLIIPQIGPYPLAPNVSFPWWEGNTVSGLASTYVGTALHAMSVGLGLCGDSRNDAVSHGSLMAWGRNGIRGAIYPELYPNDDTWLSPGQALALNTSRYFNPGEPAPETNSPSLSISTSGTLNPANGLLNISFNASDVSGLASALLLRNWQQIGEMPLLGTATTRTFATAYYDAGQTDKFEVLVYDMYGNRAQAEVSITPAIGFNAAPKPFIRLSTSTLRIGQAVSLDASGSTDSDDDVSFLSIEWDLNGDGVFDTSPTTTKTSTTSFGQGGTRLVSGRITDPHGAQAISAPIPVRVLGSPAEITVLGNGVSITDGDATPSTGDGTDFGSVAQGNPAVSRTFTVRNDGTTALTLGTVAVPAGFTLTEALSSSLAPGAADTFTVQLETTTIGTKTGEISFATNDSDENPFNFTITGTVTAPPVPQVTVTVAPSAVAEDGTTNLVYAFTRSVAGGSSLTVSFSVGGTAAFGTDYTQSGVASFNAALGTVVIGAGQTTAIVTVDPTPDTAVEADETVLLTVTAGTGYTVGTPSVSTGTIQNDDASGNLALGRSGTASTSYPGLPASNATDGNTSSRWSSQFSDSQWIYVDLGSILPIHRVVLRWETAYARGFKIQVSSDASNWSDAYTTTSGDGGVDDVTLGVPVSGRYVRMLGTQRGTVYGYSLWEFEVYA